MTEAWSRDDPQYGIPQHFAPLEWQLLAKALFALEHNPAIKDQAWFDFQGKAERLLRMMERAEPVPATPN